MFFIREGFSKKSIRELDVIIQKSPPESGIYQKAKKELRRREFWRKDIISWVALLISIIALYLQLFKSNGGV